MPATVTLNAQFRPIYLKPHVKSAACAGAYRWTSHWHKAVQIVQTYCNSGAAPTSGRTNQRCLPYKSKVVPRNFIARSRKAFNGPSGLGPTRCRSYWLQHRQQTVHSRLRRCFDSMFSSQRQRPRCMSPVCKAVPADLKP